MVLLILAVVWAIVLVPPALRGRSEGRPADSIIHFRRQLTTLQRTAPAGWGRPPAPATVLRSVPDLNTLDAHRLRPANRVISTQAQKRRRDIFVGLLAAMVISLVLGAIPALRLLLVVHLLADVLFAGYVTMLVRMRHEVAEREMKLRFLPGAPPRVEPALLPLQRRAN